MALGLCGLAVVLNLAVESPAFPVEVLLVVLAAAVQTVYLTKIAVCFDVFVAELADPRALSSFGAMSMTICYLGGQVHKRLDVFIFGDLLVGAGGVLQLAVMALFFVRVARLRAAPEPYWFPPTVGIAMVSIQGFACGWSDWLVLACFYTAVALMVLILPAVSVLVAARPTTISPDPSCSVLCAPASLCCVTWNLCGKPEWPFRGMWPGTILWILSTVFFVQTLFALWQRRRSLFVAGVKPTIAAFTFPLASTTASVHFICGAVFEGRVLATIYMYAMTVLCLGVILTTNVVFYARLRTWMRICQKASDPACNPEVEMSPDDDDGDVENCNAEDEDEVRDDDAEMPSRWTGA